MLINGPRRSRCPSNITWALITPIGIALSSISILLRSIFTGVHVAFVECTQGFFFFNFGIEILLPSS